MLERCTDELDMANQMQSQANEQAIETLRRAEARRVQVVKQALDDGTFDGVSCIVCDDEHSRSRDQAALPGQPRQLRRVLLRDRVRGHQARLLQLRRLWKGLRHG